jgi:hypothetical protein
VVVVLAVVLAVVLVVVLVVVVMRPGRDNIHQSGESIAFGCSCSVQLCLCTLPRQFPCRKSLRGEVGNAQLPSTVAAWRITGKCTIALSYRCTDAKCSPRLAPKTHPSASPGIPMSLSRPQSYRKALSSRGLSTAIHSELSKRDAKKYLISEKRIERAHGAESSS